jgi:cytochrome c oxidase assembly protein subunit 15
MTSALLPGALGLQVALGIGTLLSGVALPLAAAHQAGAVILFAAALWNAHACATATPLPAHAVTAAEGPVGAPGRI